MSLSLSLYNEKGAKKQNTVFINEINEDFDFILYIFSEEKDKKEDDETDSFLFSYIFDKNNQLIDKNNQLIDNNNQLINKNNQLIDNNNQLIDNNNQIIDKNKENNNQIIDNNNNKKDIIKYTKNKEYKLITINIIIKIIYFIIYIILIIILYNKKQTILIIPILIITIIPTDIIIYKEIIKKYIINKNKKEQINYKNYLKEIKIKIPINIIIVIIYIIYKQCYYSNTNKKKENPNKKQIDKFDEKWKKTLNDFYPNEMKLEVINNLNNLNNRNKDKYYPLNKEEDFEINMFNENYNVNSKELMEKNWLKYEETFKPFKRESSKDNNLIKWLVDIPDKILTNTLGRIIDIQYSINIKLIPEYEKLYLKFIPENNINRNIEPNFKNIFGYISHPKYFMKPYNELKLEDINKIYFETLNKNSKITIAIWEDKEEEHTIEFFHLMNNIINWNIFIELKNYEMILNPEKYSYEISLIKKDIIQKRKKDKYSELFEKGLTYGLHLKKDTLIGDIFIDIGRYCMIGYRGRVLITPFFGNNYSSLKKRKRIEKVEKTIKNINKFNDWKNKLNKLNEKYKKIEKEYSESIGFE